ncbi:MAG: alkaline phosphatase family protein [Ignavibacteriae bacterium]|nr:alkaline phosphatase family protein [Ignavibacteriota bacterium]
MGVLMLFLDGVGIGEEDQSVNPFFAADLPALRSLGGGELPHLSRQTLRAKDSTVIPLDATLGVEGLPQSGTGQTALFTGVNGAKIVGKHFGPYPYSTLRPIIKEKNIFRQLMVAERSVYFANAFPQRFFDYVNRRKSRMTVTTLSCTMSDVRLQRVEDLASGRGISADITNEGWPGLGYPEIKPIDPGEAGKRLAHLARQYDFVLFEYWKTDHAGHSENLGEAIEVLQLFDRMLAGILEILDTSQLLLFITSDHGNIEDMSTKVHTRNPVPAILYGHRHRVIAERFQSLTSHTGDLTDVTPILMEEITSREYSVRVASAR